MKKTQHITLGLLAGMALAFTSGCKQQHRDCVDELGRKTNDQNCTMVEQQRRSGYTGSLPYYHYLYGGSSGGNVGDAVFNGSPTPSGSGGGFFGGIMRGGFGGIGGGSGSSGGE